ncbi:MAG: hypothetical protein WA810_12450 [Maribacter sp.]
MLAKKNSREELPLADMHGDGTRFDKKTLAALKAEREKTEKKSDEKE